MKNIHKSDFLKTSAKSLEDVFDLLYELPEIELYNLQKEKSSLIIVDMINGFVREGALKSERAERIIPAICQLSKACDKLELPKIAFADSHSELSPEFESYPEHCIKGTTQEAIVDEIKEIGGYTLIEKNSTNGFLEDEFQTWLENNPTIENFIITGVCSDICIQQFAITLKTWFNKQNKKSRIIVPINGVETYDLEIHHGDLMKVTSLYNMLINGIEVVRGIIS